MTAPVHSPDIADRSTAVVPTESTRRDDGVETHLSVLTAVTLILTRSTANASAPDQADTSRQGDLAAPDEADVETSSVSCSSVQSVGGDANCDMGLQFLAPLRRCRLSPAVPPLEEQLEVTEVEETEFEAGESEETTLTETGLDNMEFEEADLDALGPEEALLEDLLTADLAEIDATDGADEDDPADAQDDDDDEDDEDEDGDHEGEVLGPDDLSKVAGLVTVLAGKACGGSGKGAVADAGKAGPVATSTGKQRNGTNRARWSKWLKRAMAGRRTAALRRWAGLTDRPK